MKRFVKLHDIVNSVLFQKGYSVHWYAQGLKHACDILRELHFDVMGTIRTKRIDRSKGMCELPCDYQDFVRVGVCQTKLPKDNGTGLYLHPAENFGVEGQIVPPFQEERFWHFDGWYGKWHYRDEIYPLLKRRYGQISRDNILEWINLGGQFILLEYVSDGSEIDNATQVDPYAQACIEAYIIWKMKAFNRSINAGEARMEKENFDREYRILKGRLNDVSPESIINSLNAAYGKRT